MSTVTFPTFFLIQKCLICEIIYYILYTTNFIPETLFKAKIKNFVAKTDKKVG